MPPIISRRTVMQPTMLVWESTLSTCGKKNLWLMCSLWCRKRSLGPIKLCLHATHPISRRCWSSRDWVKFIMWVFLLLNYVVYRKSNYWSTVMRFKLSGISEIFMFPSNLKSYCQSIMWFFHMKNLMILNWFKL